MSILLITILVVGCAPTEMQPAGEETKEPIKIGFIGPLTGDVAPYGEGWRDGALLAVEEINTAGGINGRMLELVPEDGLCKPKDATNAAQKLIEIDKVQAIVGGFCSSETLAVAPIAEEAKVVLMSPGSTNADITESGDYIFRACPSDALQGEIMAIYMYDEGYREVAIMYANSDYNLGLRNVFSKKFTELGGEIVVEQNYEQDAKDMRTQITKIKDAAPEALYLVPYPADGTIILVQMKELDVDLPVFAPESMCVDKVLVDSGEAAEGMVVSTPTFDEAAPKTAEFLQKFNDRFGYKPELTSYSANAYDVVYLFADAMKQGHITGTEIKDYLYTVTDYTGAGGKLTIDENGDAIKELILMRVENGEFVDLE